MNQSLLDRISVETLPHIRAVARNGAIQSAVVSMAAWGAINIVAWYLLGRENRAIMSTLANRSSTIDLLIYAPLILGVALLAFAALGALFRFSGAIILDGISLISVGLWNLTSDFIAMDALKSYGYALQKPSTIWLILGACQIVWGARRFPVFVRVARWKGGKAPAEEIKEFKAHLQEFVKLSEDQEGGVVKCFVTKKGPLGFDMFSKTTHYTGRLINDQAIMISAGLDDYFLIQKRDLSISIPDSDGASTAHLSEHPHAAVVPAISAKIFATWQAWICPRCQSKNPSSTVKCTSCGLEIV